MKRHALFLATLAAAAALGAAGLASAQSAPATAAADAPASHARADRQAGHAGHAKRHRGAFRAGIERMDADGDGRVSRAEFDAAQARFAEARQAAGRDADASRARARSGMRRGVDFDALDANRDGYVVRSEVRTHRERMRAEMERTRATRMAEAFAAADLNGDGRLSRVEVDEKMPRLSARFAWMDDNRDGFLDRAELQAGRGR